MRIYELAKRIGERFSIEVKSGDLANEIREMEEFKHLSATIKSHASSIDDVVVNRVLDKYADRIEAPRKRAEREEENRRQAAEAQRQEEIRLKRQQLDQQRRQEKKSQALQIESARKLREAEMQRRRRALAAESGAAPSASRPRPVQPASLTGGRLSPISVAPSAIPALGSQVEESTSSAPPPSSSPAARAQAPSRQSLRPSAPASKLRSSSGTTGITSTPEAPGGSSVSEVAARHGLRPDGQPLPPPPPSLRADSVFRARPAGSARSGALPRPIEVGRSSDRQERPARRGETGRPPVRRRGEEEQADRPLVLPEIGVMKLKPGGGGGGRRGKPAAGDKAKQAANKKKTIKTIERSEIELKPSKVYGLADEFRRPIGKKRPAGRAPISSRRAERAPRRPAGPIHLGSLMTVAQFAVKIGVPIGEIMQKILFMGRRLTLNELIDPDLCELISQEYGVEVVVEQEGDDLDIEEHRPQPDESRLKFRPPVVTIMGHVDHGKTTLLDAYRSSDVAGGEFGGITQHIGAYLVETPRGQVVFLDTPGHEAFTSMRARGASVTDIVVLVVSADDGVMPQTVEAIAHAREAGVPIIVAVNKIDLPGANPQRVRTELMQHQILPEELGGSNIFVDVSAKQRSNLDQLLEMILLQAEMLELKADPDCRAEGTIIESHLDKNRGPVATVLVRQGTLSPGDAFVVGTQSGRVRVMIDDQGRQIREAPPSHPVEVIGMTGTPEVGETFLVMSEERLAKEIAARRAGRRRIRELAGGGRHVSLETLHELVAEGKLKELKIILKADVQGSLEAVAQSLMKLGNEEVRVRILHQGTGAVTESDVQLADASDAIVTGFNVRPDPAAAHLADRQGIDIKTYNIIYKIKEDFEKALTGMLDKRYREIEVGRVEIRKVFKVSRLGNIAGCMVLEGEVTRNAQVRLVRDGAIVYTGKIGSLRRVKDDVARVAAGYECGITLDRFQDIKESDIVEVFKMEEIPAELVSA